MNLTRNLLQRLMAAVLLCAMCAAQAQTPATPIRALGVYSLLGDAVQVTVAQGPTDSRIDRAARDSYDVKGIDFDGIVLRAIREAVSRELPGASLQQYRATTPLSAAEQRDIAEGARGGVLPAWIVETINPQRLSHVLLVTRHRVDAKLRTGDGDAIGRAKVEGLGFYLDGLYKVRNSTTGAVAQGALGPHVVILLTLMDTESAEVLRTQIIDRQWLVGPREYGAAIDPWSYLTPVEKINALRGALQVNAERVLPVFLKGP